MKAPQPSSPCAAKLAEKKAAARGPAESRAKGKRRKGVRLEALVEKLPGVAAAFVPELELSADQRARLEAIHPAPEFAAAIMRAAETPAAFKEHDSKADAFTWKDGAEFQAQLQAQTLFLSDALRRFALSSTFFPMLKQPVWIYGTQAKWQSRPDVREVFQGAEEALRSLLWLLPIGERFCREQHQEFTAKGGRPMDGRRVQLAARVRDVMDRFGLSPGKGKEGAWTRAFLVACELAGLPWQSKTKDEAGALRDVRRILDRAEKIRARIAAEFREAQNPTA